LEVSWKPLFFSWKGQKILIVRFGDNSLDKKGYIFFKGTEPVSLEPLVFSLLLYLLENRERVVSKDELVEHVWQGRAVSDAAITSAVNLARRAVDDDGKKQSVIKTFPRRGFRFVAEITEDENFEANTVTTDTAFEKPSIAVLPFDNLSGDCEQNYFADGISEDLITALSRFRRLVVTARNTSFAYADESKDKFELGRNLGVRYLLEGSVRKAGNRIRINVQLIETTGGNHVWAERYDRDLTDIFDVQDELTRRIAIAIEPEITLAEIERAKTFRTDNITAWDFYLRALPHFHFVTKQDNALAIAELEKAIKLDDGYVPAIALLALCHVYSVLHGWSKSRSEMIKKAGELTTLATSIDPSDPAANLAMSWYCLYDNQLERGLTAARNAAEQEPNSFIAWCQVGSLLAHLCRAEEAYNVLRSIEKSSVRDPWRWWWYMNWGNAYFAGGRYEDAVNILLKGKELRPSWYGFYVILAASAANSGQQKIAEEAVELLLKVLPRATMRGFRRYPTFAKQSVIDALITGLQKAGVPEE